MLKLKWENLTYKQSNVEYNIALQACFLEWLMNCLSIYNLALPHHEDMSRLGATSKASRDVVMGKITRPGPNPEKPAQKIP